LPDCGCAGWPGAMFGAREGVRVGMTMRCGGGGLARRADPQSGATAQSMDIEHNSALLGKDGELD